MSRKVKVNMEGVESFTRCPEGEWLAQLKKAEMGEVQGSGDDCIKAQFEVIKGSAKGNTVFETFSLTEKALWKLKSFLDAVGMKSNGKLTLDLDKMEGKVCIIDVIHDEYNGQKRAKISSYIKPGEDDDEDEDIDDEDEDIDEDEEDDEEEEAPKKKGKKAASKSAPAKKSKKRPEPEEDDEDDEDDDEDNDEEEDEPPVKSKKGKKAAPAKSNKKSSAKSKKKAKDEDDDEDDDWEEDDD
jgi:chemotaxis protein histidine kinase CheA